MDATPTTTNGKKERTGAAEAIAPPTPPVVDYTTHLFSVDEVFESPLNIRKTFVLIEDLAEDIKKRGLIEPIVVRARKAGGWEIAAGARRFRAAKIARLEQLPCQVRTLTDAELIELAIAENGKRADLHPLEEAEGFQALKTEHGYTVKMIAARFNKSESHVLQRLLLHNGLAPELRKMSLAGELDTAIAIYAARIPTHDMQRAFIKELHVDGTMVKPTARNAIELIQRRYLLRLIDAPFDRADAKLLAGVPACTTCPKRTGNQGELFNDIKSPDMCTDPSCFEKKRNAGWNHRVATAKGAGLEVIKEVVPSWSMAPPRYVTLSMKPIEDKKGRTYRQLLKGEMPPVEAIARKEDGTILDLVKESTVHAALIAAGHKFAEPRKPTKSEPSAKKKDKADSELDEAICERTKAALMETLVARAIVKEPTVAVWAAIIRQIQDSGFGTGPHDVSLRRGLKPNDAVDLGKFALTLKAPAARALAIELLASDDWKTQDALFEAYGVDDKKIAKLAREDVLADAKKVDDEPARDAKARKAAETTLKRGGKKTTAKKGAKR